MRGFDKKISGSNPLDPPAGQLIDLQMDQWEFEVSWAFGIGR